jgi:hypothetical protein
VGPGQGAAIGDDLERDAERQEHEHQHGDLRRATEHASPLRAVEILQQVRAARRASSYQRRSVALRHAG